MSLTVQRLMQRPTVDGTPSFTVLLEEIDRLRQRANAVMRFVDCVHLKRQSLDINAFLRERVAFYQQTVLTPVKIILSLRHGDPDCRDRADGHRPGRP